MNNKICKFISKNISLLGSFITSQNDYLQIEKEISSILNQLENKGIMIHRIKLSMDIIDPGSVDDDGVKQISDRPIEISYDCMSFHAMFDYNTIEDEHIKAIAKFIHQIEYKVITHDELDHFMNELLTIYHKHFKSGDLSTSFAILHKFGWRVNVIYECRKANKRGDNSYQIIRDSLQQHVYM